MTTMMMMRVVKRRNKKQVKDGKMRAEGYVQKVSFAMTSYNVCAACGAMTHCRVEQWVYLAKYFN